MTINVNGLLIRSLRLEKSWSQNALAEKAGVSLRTVQRMEIEGIASLQSRRAVADALRVSAAELAPTIEEPPVRSSLAKRLSRTRLTALATTFAAGAIVATGAFYWITQRGERPLYQEFIATVGYGDVAGPIRAAGWVVPKDVEAVRIDAVGRPVELIAELTEYVEEGQIIAMIDGAEVRAPMAGRITSFEPRDGAIVSGLQTAPLVVEISSYEALTAITSVPELELVALDSRTEVYLTTSRSEGRWDGELSRINPVANMRDNVILYRANVDVVDPDSELSPYFTAQVFFDSGSAENVLIVPLSALRFSSASEIGARSVEVALPDGTTERRTIVVGAMDSVNAEIISGLNAGDRVVARRTRS